MKTIKLIRKITDGSIILSTATLDGRYLFDAWEVDHRSELFTDKTIRNFIPVTGVYYIYPFFDAVKRCYELHIKSEDGQLVSKMVSNNKFYHYSIQLYENNNYFEIGNDYSFNKLLNSVSVCDKVFHILRQYIAEGHKIQISIENAKNVF